MTNGHPTLALIGDYFELEHMNGFKNWSLTFSLSDDPGYWSADFLDDGYSFEQALNYALDKAIPDFITWKKEKDNELAV